MSGVRILADVHVKHGTLLGAGLRHFVVAPVAFEGFLAVLSRIELEHVRRATQLARKMVCPSELDAVLEGYA